MDKNDMKNFYNVIKKFDNIFIARHIGADPDALGSQIGLKDIILETFPSKNVFAVGNYSAKFKYMGALTRGDSIDTTIYKDSLLIVLDTPNAIRIDNAICTQFNYVIKLDHHPFIERFADLEIIDDKASSTCQMILEIVNNTKFKINKKAAENLFLGLIADTNRFMYSYTSPETFRLVADLIEKTNIDFCSLYNKLYLRRYNDLKFQGYIAENFIITENGLAYIIVDDKKLKEMGVDAATAGNLIHHFNHISEYTVWLTISEDVKQGIYKISIRSRGPVINTVAESYGGGGHKLASGIRLKDKSLISDIISDLDEVCKTYMSKQDE